MSEKGTKTLERNVLVLAIKEINKELGMTPPIPTKTKKGDKIPAEELSATLLKYAQGFNDETGKMDKELAITRNDNLSPATFSVLEAIGALKSAKAEKSAPAKADKAPAKAEKADKPAKAKKAKKNGETRELAMLNVLTSYTGTNEAIVLAYDKLLIKKQSMEAHQAEATKLQKTLKAELDLQKHINYRTKYSGFIFAKEEGNFFLQEVDVSKAQKYKVPAITVVHTGKASKPTAPATPPPAKENSKKVTTPASKDAGKKKAKK